MMTIIKNHYNENTRYEYDEDSNATHQRTYHVDEHPSDTYPEDDKNIKTKSLISLKKTKHQQNRGFR